MSGSMTDPLTQAVDAYLLAVNAAIVEGAFGMNSILDADGVAVARMTMQQAKASARLVSEAIAALLTALDAAPEAKPAIPAHALGGGKQRVGLFVPR